MKTQAYFDNIQLEIIKQLNNANTSIYVAVAWLTDKTIFKILCDKVSQNIKVELLLINDEINNEKAPFNHRDIETAGGKVYFIPPTKQGSIMHHKFCIIDTNVIITGSYNWSLKAQHNDENLVVTTDAFELGQQFIQEFNSIKARVLKDEIISGEIDIQKVLKRFDVIKGFILLDEKDEILGQIKKLREQPNSLAIIEIINSLEKEQYATASMLIEQFREANSKLVLFEDFDIFALQLEIRSIEIQLNALENEKVEIEKSLHEFTTYYNKELGVLILEIFKIQKQLAIDENEKEKIENEKKEYESDYEKSKNITIQKLSIEDEKELKNAYREASFKCHPDKFQDDPVKANLAQEVFIQLTDAYKSNNLTLVREILYDLKSGKIQIKEDEKSSKKEILRMQLSNLRNKIKDLNIYISHLKTSDTFIVISQNNNIPEYISELKDKLRYELELLKTELAQSGDK